MKSFRFGSPVSIATIVSITILCTALFFLQRNINKEAEAWQWVVHTREVIESLQTTLTLIQAAESSQRGFLLTNSPPYLEEHQHAVKALFSEIRQLQQLTSDNPVQQQALRVYADLTAQRIQKMEEVRSIGFNGQRMDAAMIEPGRQLKENLLKQAAKIKGEEERLLLERQQTVERARTELVAVVAAVVAVAILLIVLLWFISERDAVSIRQAQHELAEANRHLEQRIQERTQQIAEANEELRAFAHTVAHDLRAPLRNVEGFSTALLEDESERLSEDGKLFANRIVAAVMRMDRLITDLLAYSRLSRAEIRLETVQLDKVVQTVKRDLESEIAQSGASIDVTGSLPAVKANEGVLVQVLSNLVSNAIKFVAKGVVPHIRIHGRTGQGFAYLIVEDNGIGIRPEQHERIFGVFERLHGQEQYPGTGIGLAIVKRGTERMGGKVKVAGLPSGGSVFEIALPAAN